MMIMSKPRIEEVLYFLCWVVLAGRSQVSHGFSIPFILPGWRVDEPENNATATATMSGR